ncbi:12S rRNA N(4)-cytidine methyltransferase METTL15-like [Antedon mediterranea]|uniref:12S rRNA N(4)-cytidine methyltransferase METTL15-like n=1 Tax=Antedon mediterranea TaxID=105859 RepID=UPI003AF599F6
MSLCAGRLLHRQFSTSICLKYPRSMRLRNTSSPALEKETNDNVEFRHFPVMKNEILAFLDPKEDEKFLDMTFGGGGHSRSILKCSPTSQVFALDRDPVAYNIAKTLSINYRDRLHPMLGRFSELDTVAKDIGLQEGILDGVVIDAGCSSMQFDTAERGFALSKSGPLDMRMDGDNRHENQPTAADVVNSLNVETLARIIKAYGEERQAKKIAQLIVEFREKYHPIKTTSELANIVSFAFTHTQSSQSKDMIGRKMHVATRTFQALRIFVNNELEELSNGLNLVSKFLKPGGRIAVLTFHSLEDRIVKRILQGRHAMEPGKSIHQKKRDNFTYNTESGHENQIKIWSFDDKFMEPSEKEVEKNPRSRSAKLRKAVKL